MVTRVDTVALVLRAVSFGAGASTDRFYLERYVFLA